MIDRGQVDKIGGCDNCNVAGVGGSGAGRGGLKMKQRISKDLIQRRYDEFRMMGWTSEETALRIGQLLLNYYGIDYETMPPPINKRRF